jgi:hypothetical protein
LFDLVEFEILALCFSILFTRPPLLVFFLDLLQMENDESHSDSTIPSYLYEGLCLNGKCCSCSYNGRSHSYSGEILRWTKKDLLSYQKAIEDDAISRFRDILPSTTPEEELPSYVLEYFKDSPYISEEKPKTPVKSEEDIENLVVPDTPEEIITSRVVKNPKKRK